MRYLCAKNGAHTIFEKNNRQTFKVHEHAAGVLGSKGDDWKVKKELQI
jgi:hypothetical protein